MNDIFHINKHSALTWPRLRQCVQSVTQMFRRTRSEQKSTFKLFFPRRSRRKLQVWSKIENVYKKFCSIGMKFEQTLTTRDQEKKNTWCKLKSRVKLKYFFNGIFFVIPVKNVSVWVSYGTDKLSYSKVVLLYCQCGIWKVKRKKNSAERNAKNLSQLWKENNSKYKKQHFETTFAKICLGQSSKLTR